MRAPKTREEIIRAYKRLNPSLSDDDVLILADKEISIREEVIANKEYLKYKPKPPQKNPKRGFQKKHKVNTYRTVKRKAKDENFVMDHLGHKFKNRQMMCDFWGLTTEQFHTRDAKGWKLKDILTRPVRARRTTHQKIADEINEWNKKNV